MDGSRDRIRSVIVVLLVVGTSLLTAGGMRAIEPVQADLSPQSMQRLPVPTTIWAGDTPVLEVTTDGQVRLLAEWDPRVPLTIDSATTCTSGGIVVAAGNASEEVCNGRDGVQGATGAMGPLPWARLLVDTVEMPTHPACGAGGVMILIGTDDGSGTSEADDGQLHADEVDAESVVCHGAGRDGASGTSGSNGSPGAHALIMLDAASEEDCEHGGILVRSGSDDGRPSGTFGNGMLDAGEETLARAVCNGAPGDGAGESSTHHASLLHVRDATVQECNSGGVVVETGLDDGQPGGAARSGTLEPAEVDATVPFCPATNGGGTDGISVAIDEQPANDSECVGAGRRIHFGLDDGDPSGTARNNLLEEGERENSILVCNNLVTGEGACVDGAIVHGFDDHGHVVCRPEEAALTTIPGIPSIQTIPFGVQGAISVVTGSDGLPFIAVGGYQDRTIWAIHCLDRRCIAWESTLVHQELSPNSIGSLPMAAIGVDGFPVIAVHRQSGNPGLLIACADHACASSWNAPIGGVHHVEDLVVGADPATGPAYYVLGTGFNDDSYVFACPISNRCAGGTSVKVADSYLQPGGNRRGSTTDNALDLGNDGRLYVTHHHDATNTVRRLQVYTGAATTLDSYTSHSMNLAVGTGLDGRPYVLHRPSGDGPLRLTRCADAPCTTRTPWQEIDVPATYAWPFPTVRDDGNVAFLAHGQPGLVVVQCLDSTCTATETRVLTTQAAAGDLTMARDGSVVAAWRETVDFAFGDIKVFVSGGAGLYGYQVRR